MAEATQDLCSLSEGAIFFKSLIRFLYNYLFCVYWWGGGYYMLCMEVRGQFARVRSLLSSTVWILDIEIMSTGLVESIYL